MNLRVLILGLTVSAGLVALALAVRNKPPILPTSDPPANAAPLNSRISIPTVTAYLAGIDLIEKSIGPAQDEAIAADEFDLVSDFEVLRVQIADLKQLGQEIQRGTAGQIEHDRFRDLYQQYVAQEKRIQTGIDVYQQNKKRRFQKNANEMGFAGIDFSLPMREFNMRYPARTVSAEHNPATNSCTFSLQNIGPAGKLSQFEFVDDELCKISFGYHASFWNQFGGPQGIALRIKERIGPATKSQEVDGLTIVEWHFPERKILLAVNDEIAVVQIIHLPRDAKRAARQTASDNVIERKVLSRDAGF